MNAFRVGLIGIGGMGTILQRALQRLNISIFAVMSRHSETGSRKAQQMGALFCPNLDAFVKSGVDIAI
ncbi:MAG: NAD(P)-binding domain-containing protein, partial [Candidatus Caldatribacteriaceae bacterium]